MRAIILSAVIFFGVIAIVFSSVVFFAFPLKHKSYIQSSARAHNVDPILVASVIRAESGFKSRAVSPKGAIGLMQIMPATGDYIAAKSNSYFRKGGVTEGDGGFDLFDPKTNIDMGTWYLKYLLDKFGDKRTALMAYNAGEGNVTRWLAGKDRLTTTPFPETNAYVERVLNGMTYYRYRI